MCLQKTLFVAIYTIFFLTACGGGGGGNNTGSNGGATGVGGQSNPDASSPDANSRLPEVSQALAYNDVSVHDPSVVDAGDGYWYVIGSHLAMAKTEDFVQWQSVADGVDDNNLLFNTYASEIAEGIEYVGGWAGSWAGDIIQLDDDRWYFYYDHCATAAAGLCDFPRSYLGVAAADSIEGPYTNNGVFLWSGQTQDELENGLYRVGDLSQYDPRIHPNAIDPDTFFDKDQNLWMVYGSYSGGIYVLDMNEVTGLAEPGQGYGSHIGGGDHSNIEGPFIFYSPQTDYYYLFTSFGGFAANDGYNIRIFRSRNPAGPFLDSQSFSLEQARGDWAAISPYGNKIMGGFSFLAANGAAAWGYKAPGHNSAIYDAQNGKHLLVLHTRFPNRGEAHAIRVHELFVTEDDWLVPSPERFAPMTGENVVSGTDLHGDYQLINHGKDINRTVKTSIDVSLLSNGGIQGAVRGSYVQSSVNASWLTLTLDGNSYESVVQWQWSIRSQKLIPVIAGVSSTGETVWLSKI